MLTISAKELRINLSEYLKRAMAGEEIEVIYHSKPAVKLLSATHQTHGNAPEVIKAIRDYNQKVKSVSSSIDPITSVKEQYHAMLDQDSKYQGR